MELCIDIGAVSTDTLSLHLCVQFLFTYRNTYRYRGCVYRYIIFASACTNFIHIWKYVSISGLCLPIHYLCFCVYKFYSHMELRIDIGAVSTDTLSSHLCVQFLVTEYKINLVLSIAF